MIAASVSPTRTRLATSQLQGRQPQRRGAEEGVRHQAHDQEPLATDPVHDPTREGGGKTNHECRRGEDDRGQGCYAGSVCEGFLDPRQYRCQQHRADNEVATLIRSCLDAATITVVHAAPELRCVADCLLDLLRRSAMFGGVVQVAPVPLHRIKAQDALLCCRVQ